MPLACALRKLKAFSLTCLSTPDLNVRIIPVTEPTNGALSAVGTIHYNNS